MADLLFHAPESGSFLKHVPEFHSWKSLFRCRGQSKVFATNLPHGNPCSINQDPVIHLRTLLAHLWAMTMVNFELVQGYIYLYYIFLGGGGVVVVVVWLPYMYPFLSTLSKEKNAVKRSFILDILFFPQ